MDKEEKMKCQTCKRVIEKNHTYLDCKDCINAKRRRERREKDAMVELFQMNYYKLPNQNQRWRVSHYSLRTVLKKMGATKYDVEEFVYKLENDFIKV